MRQQFFLFRRKSECGSGIKTRIRIGCRLWKQLSGAGLDPTLNRHIYLLNNYFFLFTAHSSANTLLNAMNEVPHWVLETNLNPGGRHKGEWQTVVLQRSAMGTHRTKPTDSGQENEDGVPRWVTRDGYELTVGGGGEERRGCSSAESTACKHRSEVGSRSLLFFFFFGQGRGHFGRHARKTGLAGSVSEAAQMPGFYPTMFMGISMWQESRWAGELADKPEKPGKGGPRVLGPRWSNGNGDNVGKSVSIRERESNKLCSQGPCSNFN